MLKLITRANFSEVWPRQILELGKQFNLMARQDVLKMSSRRLQNVLETSWRSLDDVFTDALKTFWIRFCKKSWRRLSKTSWRGFENVLKTSSRSMTKTNILVLIKTSWRCLEDVFSSQRRKTSSRCLYQDECLLGYLWLIKNHLLLLILYF